MSDSSKSKINSSKEKKVSNIWLLPKFHILKIKIESKIRGSNDGLIQYIINPKKLDDLIKNIDNYTKILRESNANQAKTLDLLTDSIANQNRTLNLLAETITNTKKLNILAELLKKQKENKNE